LIVVPRPFPAAPFLVHRSYLTVLRTYLIVAPRSVLGPLPAVTRRCRIRRRALGR
jgi:hypothetical protein